MATALRLRRGTTSQHSTFTGLEGEVTVDTTKDTVVVHDGSTAGGFPLAKETGSTVAVAAGAVGTPGLTVSGDTNTGIFFPAADTIAFAEGGAEAMRIDSSGNVGIGVTPSAWGTASNVKALQLPGVSLFGFNSLNMYLMANAYFDGTNFKYTTTGSATEYEQVSGSHRWYYAASGTANNNITFTEAMRIDSSGNLLIGGTSTTPFYGTGPGIGITNATPAIYLSKTGTGARNWLNYVDGSGSLAWYDGTAGAERMRIDSSGNVGIGTTSASGYRLTVYDTTNSYLKIANSTTGTTGSDGFDLAAIGSDAYIIQRENAPLIFYTNANERARITSGGYFKASNNGTYNSSTASFYEFNTTANNETILQIRNSGNSTPYGLYIGFSGATPNNTTEYFLNCTDSTNAKCIIYSSGTISNRTGTYNAISDAKLKQDVVDASSQWNDIKALRIVKYRLKDEVAADPNYPAYIGVIAQEVEQVSPGLIDNCPDFEEVTKTREVEKTREVTPAVLDEEGNEIEPAVTETYTEEEEYQERVATGTVTKSVKSSIIYMKAVKALQEAMARIETLEAQNAAFEARLAALEAK